MPSILHRTACALALAFTASATLAGRPLATDDAATAPARSCQVESWADRGDVLQGTIVSGACGVVDGFELGLELTRPQPRGEVRTGAGLALKLAPQAWGADTGAGAVRFGLKAAVASERTRVDGWSAHAPSLLGLVSFEPADAWALHANLGLLRDGASRTSGGVVALAAVWTPVGRLLFFAEGQASNRREIFGPPVRSAGVRWWLVPERFGIDLVASRESGSAGTSSSIGFGWYGLGL